MIQKVTSPSSTIIVFSVYLSFLWINGINISIPLFAVFVAIGLFAKKFVKQEIWIWTVAISFLFATVIARPEFTRVSSAIYSCIFFVIAISFTRGIYNSKLTLESYMKVCRYLVIVYFTVLVIQQLCVLAGVPAFNVMIDYSEVEGSRWKLSSLSDEPSHAARIVALLAFSYIGAHRILYGESYSFIKEWKSSKSERLFWIAFFWTMITMQSSTALLFVVIILFRFFVVGKVKIGTLLIGAISVMILVFAFSNNKLMKRNIDIMAATLTLDEIAIEAADNSGAHRIVPMITLAKRVEIFTENGLFGFGMDTSKKVVYRNFPGWMDENVAGGGGVFQIWYDFGFIVFLSYVLGSLKFCTSPKDKMSYLFWFLLIFVNGLNTQITWLAIMLLATNKYFIEKNTNKSISRYEINRY